jgi:protoporphyrinogen oxidase
MIIIAGAGLAGMSTALFLKRPHVVLEKELDAGGLVRTVHQGGFSFDYAGHWFHARLDWVKILLGRILEKNWAWHPRDARIWSHNVLTHYPFQINLGGLPNDVIVDCLMGMIEAKYARPQGPVRTFEDFILTSMGRGVARHFMVPYNTKLWHLAPRRMTWDWTGRFVPAPEIEKALRSALDPDAQARAGYNAGFHYPVRGGAGAIARALAGQIRPPQFGVEVTRVHARRRRVECSDGQDLEYEALVSTMPLRRLAEITVDAPAEVRRAAKALRWVAINVLNLGVTGASFPCDWIYVPDKEPRFFRAGSYSHACSGMAPRGATSLYIESSYPTRVPPKTAAMTGAYALRWLKRMGVLPPKARLAVETSLRIDCGYVLFDPQRHSAVETLQRYFRKHGIHSIGRYGSWEYSSMEDAMNQGKVTAEALNAQS